MGCSVLSSTSPAFQYTTSADNHVITNVNAAFNDFWYQFQHPYHIEAHHVGQSGLGRAALRLALITCLLAQIVSALDEPIESDR